jgi:hypothetical protein
MLATLSKTHRPFRKLSDEELAAVKEAWREAHTYCGSMDSRHNLIFSKS